MKAKFLIPLGIFIVLVGFLGYGLTLNPREIPSPLIGKPAPAFAAPQLDDPSRTFTLADMRGKVWLLNVWASWCSGCAEEHETLVEFSRRRAMPIVGLDYKDTPVDATKWLRQRGNPYDLTVLDPKGMIGLDYGVYGVPETFVIDGQGVVIHKHIGPLTPQVIESKIMPLLAQAGGAK
ncbi:MAG: DsbE family thiol:disulfide interchange protein [Rhodocyclaceae bacterium]|nr:DsbE family thiol:disulfide interchange protein [Rhodocyclaceae bacterium]